MTQGTKRRVIGLFGALLLLAGCGKAPDTVPQSGKIDFTGKLQVIATFSVLDDLVRQVGGDQIEVVTLVGPDGDAHTFEPAPSDAVALAKANVIVANGAGFEPWLDKLYASSQSKARRIVASKGLKLREAEEEEKKDGKHDHEEHDPHVWHDVKNVICEVGNIRDALADADPANAEKYKANAAVYLKHLDQLDQWVQQQAATLPKDRRKLVTSHDTFGYFAQRYGFEVVGAGLESFSTEAAEPSAASFAKLVAAIKKAQVPAIFAENVQNPKLMERLAQEAGVRLAPPLFTDALGKPGSAGDTYLKMMRHNVSTIVAALKP